MSRTNARKDAFCLLFQREFVAHEEMENAKDLFFEDNPEIESIDVEVRSYVYGEGEVTDANEYEVAYFTKRGPEFLERSTVKPYEESNFIILTDNEEMEETEEPMMEM